MMSAHPMGLQVQHLLLEHVFHLSTRTIKLLVEPAGIEPLAISVLLETARREVRHHKPRVISGTRHFGFAKSPVAPGSNSSGSDIQIRQTPARWALRSNNVGRAHRPAPAPNAQ